MQLAEPVLEHGMTAAHPDLFADATAAAPSGDDEAIELICRHVLAYADDSARIWSVPPGAVRRELVRRLTARKQ